VQVLNPKSSTPNRLCVFYRFTSGGGASRASLPILWFHAPGRRKGQVSEWAWVDAAYAKVKYQKRRTRPAVWIQGAAGLREASGSIENTLHGLYRRCSPVPALSSSTSTTVEAHHATAAQPWANPRARNRCLNPVALAPSCTTHACMSYEEEDACMHNICEQYAQHTRQAYVISVRH
jgi:hypothetical protein